MVFISIHNNEKIEISKFWLDSNTFVLKLVFINNKKEKTVITTFSKTSEQFNNILPNIIELSNSNSE